MRRSERSGYSYSASERLQRELTLLLENVFEIVLGATLIGWVALGIILLWSTRRIPVLRPDEATGRPLPREPGVSIIVAARNEEEALPEFLESVLQLDYSSYEVILVDDDSADRTGAIADDWAGRPEFAGRLRVIHNRRLPTGWGGKVHALSLAARAARGEWVLSTDADVVFHPAILRLAIRCALERDAQMVSLAPEFELGSWWERVMLPAFSLLLLTLFPARLVNDLRSRRAIAAGAFILMRRSDLEALGGYERLRTTVIEDLRLAELFKRNGRRIFVAFTRGLFRTKMYNSFNEMWEGLSRSAFEGARFSVSTMLAGVAFGTLPAVLPWVAVIALLVRDASHGLSATRDASLLLALGGCVTSLVVYLPLVIAVGVPGLYVLTLPLAALIYTAAALNSAWKSLVGGGVTWKGRSYRKPRA